METWIMADHASLRSFFGNQLISKALLPENDLESRDRHVVQNALESATSKCKSPYCKGDRSFEILAQLNPATLIKHLPYFKRFLDTLKKYL